MSDTEPAKEEKVEGQGGMRVLVTGGAGYIGSVAVERLVAQGHSVVVFDNLVKGHTPAVDPGATFVEGDLLNVRLVEETLAKYRIQAVMHFAAHSLVGESMQVPGKYFENNVSGSVNLANAMLRTGAKILVFSSSAATYGVPQNDIISESDANAPINPYGESKLLFEHMLRWYDEANDLKFASLRYFNAAGASERFGEMHDPETHLIPIVLQAAMGQRKAVQVFGDDYPTRDGTAVRDYVHVIDLADAHLLALDWLAGGGESQIFNLGNGEGFSVNEVIEAARRVTGKEIRAEVVARRAGDPPVLVASSQKIRSMLGWEPHYPTLESIIETAWAWHQKHPRGYE